MKSLFYVMIIVTNIIILVSCGKESIQDPEAIGKNTFEILQNIDQYSLEEYKSNLISINELRELAKNEDVITKESKRNILSKIPIEKWNEQIEEDYNKLIEIGAEDEINWSQIEFLDYIYQIKTDSGAKETYGTLSFKFNNKKYNVKINSIYDGNEFKIIAINRIVGYDLE